MIEMKAMELIRKQTEELAKKAGLPEVKHIAVYEEVRGINGLMIKVPARKVDSYHALGLVVDQEVKVRIA